MLVKIEKVWGEEREDREWSRRNVFNHWFTCLCTLDV